ncbi:hypothetical protein ACIG5E_18625 [Kitasatospora sp. NPDC053057]
MRNHHDHRDRRHRGPADRILAFLTAYEEGGFHYLMIAADKA